mmetsp:Transcript_31865/g.55448  ORF Transcript_31865/g.55448 Transcript_31865/m.55448 type:complete len:396 (-) Transcript_31865:56-1243(-)
MSNSHNQLLGWPIDALHEEGKGNDNAFTLRPYVGYAGHENTLLPKWQVLAEKLRRCRSDRFVAMCFRGVHLVKDVLDKLAPAIAMKHLKTLTLHTNRLDNDGYLFLSQFLEGNSTLTSLSLRKNVINCDIDTAKRLAAAMRNHAALGTVDISDCSLGSTNIDVFSAIIGGVKNIDNVTLSSNGIGLLHGNERTHIIANILATNPGIKKLKLNKNSLVDRDLVLIAQALSTNDNLACLDIFQNKLNKIGVEALDNAICNSSNLNAVVDCNHTCDVRNKHSRLPRQYNKPFHFPCNKEEAIRKRIHRKVLGVLGANKDAGMSTLLNMQHLSDLPLELMPNVLAMIQGEKKLTKEGDLTKKELLVALNNILEVTRKWNFPTLYQFGSKPNNILKRKRE